STAGEKTIQSLLIFKDTDIVLGNTASLTPILDTEYIASQIQIEKYESGILIYEPDWIPFSRIETTYIDDRVNRAFTYKYRYRLRSIDANGLPLVTSQFSTIIEQPSWA
ncbi:MAG: hypothetical protein ACXABY_36870, partial [Candidatus Thorarchaeota archaeon]